jgi:SAM-dependent methyltransferase
MAQQTQGKVTGIDIDEKKLKEAETILPLVPNVSLQVADVTDLPFEDDTFDLVVFTIVLIYIPDQQKALDEMARVTKKGGFVLGVMEPDYASRVDYPDNPMAPMILKNMEKLGADLKTGRKLKALFNTAGLQTESGIDSSCDYIIVKDDEKRAQMVRNQDWIMDKMLKADGWEQEKIDAFKKERVELAEKGLSFNFTPTFYAIGKKV